MMQVDKEKYIRFETLFKKSYRNLYLHAIGFVKDSEVAKDIVNEIFLYFWENSDRLTDNSLFVLVRNASIDYLRHQSVEQKYLRFISECYSDNYILDDDFSDRVEKVLSHIEELPPQMRSVFKSCLDGKSYKEVAKDYNISPNTVRNHIASALKILRKTTFFLFLSFFI